VPAGTVTERSHARTIAGFSFVVTRASGRATAGARGPSSPGAGPGHGFAVRSRYVGTDGHDFAEQPHAKGGAGASQIFVEQPHAKGAAGGFADFHETTPCKGAHRKSRGTTLRKGTQAPRRFTKQPHARERRAYFQRNNPTVWAGLATRSPYLGSRTPGAKTRKLTPCSLCPVKSADQCMAQRRGAP
jgi:hypothetical protein